MSGKAELHEGKGAEEGDVQKAKEKLQGSLTRAGEAAEPYQEGIQELKKQRMSVKTKGSQVAHSIKERKQAVIDLWTKIMDETLDQAARTVDTKLGEIEDSIKVCEDYLRSYMTGFVKVKTLLAAGSPEASDLKKTAADLDVLSTSQMKPIQVDPLSMVYGNRLNLYDIECSLRNFQGELLDIEEKLLGLPPCVGVADYCFVPGSGLFVSGSASNPKSRIWKETNGKLEEEYGTGADGLSISHDGKQLFATLEHLQKVNVFDIKDNGHLEFEKQIGIANAKFIQGIDVRSDGCLAIADYKAWRITIHEPDGTLQRELRVGEEGQPIFTEPLFVKWATDNSLYVTDRVCIMHVQINPVKILWTTPISSAWSVSILATSELYVSLRECIGMVQLNKTGEIIQSFEGSGPSTFGIYTNDQNKKVLLSYVRG